MRTLVDGHNALFALGLDSERHDAARDLLARRVAEAAGGEAILFFDARSAPKGAPASTRRHGVEIRFCRKAAADEEILAEVRGTARPSELLLVTDDRELSGRARQLGARVRAVAAFLPEERPPPAGEKEGAGGALRPEDFGLPDRVNLKRPPRDLRPRDRPV